jgi:hypothetical protein
MVASISVLEIDIFVFRGLVVRPEAIAEVGSADTWDRTARIARVLTHYF